MILRPIPELTDQVIRWVIFLLAIALVIFGAGLAAFGGVSAGALCFTMATVLLVFLYLSRFKKFSGLGLSGELWEDKQKEAAELIDRLGRLSFAYARPVISLAAFVGRWSSGFSRVERFNLIESVSRTMRENGATDSEISDARVHFDRMVAIDLMAPIHEAIRKHVDQATANERAAINLRFPQPIVDNEGHNQAVRGLRQIERLRYPWEERWKHFPGVSEIQVLDELLVQLREAGHQGVAELLEFVQPRRDDAEVWFRDRKLRRPDVYFSEGE